MIKNIISGIKAYFGAFSLISKLKLWKFFAVPMLISFVTATIIFSSAYGLSDNVGNFISKIWIWDWGKETFTSISTFIGGLVILVIGLILFKHIIMALSAPFMSPVSEKIEAHLTGNAPHSHRDTTFLEQLMRCIKINGRNLLMELLLTIPLLILKFIPVVNIFSAILLFLLQAYYAGFGILDYTMERHLNYKNSIYFAHDNRGLVLGIGTVFMLILLIPVAGFFFAPTFATIASVKLVLDKMDGL